MQEVIGRPPWRLVLGKHLTAPIGTPFTGDGSRAGANFVVDHRGRAVERGGGFARQIAIHKAVPNGGGDLVARSAIAHRLVAGVAHPHGRDHIGRVANRPAIAHIGAIRARSACLDRHLMAANDEGIVLAKRRLPRPIVGENVGHEIGMVGANDLFDG